MNEEPEITCKRCGKCCLLPILELIGDDDLDRWRQEGRDDILHIVENAHGMWTGDRVVSSEDGRDLGCCAFLEQKEDHFACAIYETRLWVCEDFPPGSSEICPQYRKRN